MLHKDNLSIDSIVYVIIIMVIMATVIRSGGIFYQPLSAGTITAILFKAFVLFYDIEFYFM